MNSQQKDLEINQYFETLDTFLEEGPPDDMSAEEFLRVTADTARQLVGAIEALTPQDVDEIWIEDETEGLDGGEEKD